MPQNPARKARTRAEILDHAARLFRLRGHAGTNIDDIMLAAGLTRGAFYAHFKSKDDLFAEVVRAGHGLLSQLRAGEPPAVLKAYLDKSGLSATAQGCTLAALPGDVARAPLAARLAFANVLYATIGELARNKKRKLDADATVATILALVGPNALHDHAVVGPQPHQRRVLLQPGDELFRLGELVVVQRHHDGLLAGIDAVHPGGAAQQLERPRVQQELGLGRHLAEAVDHLGSEGIDLGLIGE